MTSRSPWSSTVRVPAPGPRVAGLDPGRQPDDEPHVGVVRRRDIATRPPIE